MGIHQNTNNHTLSSLGAAFGTDNFRLIKLATRSQAWSATVKIYRKLEEALAQHAAFFDSVKSEGAIHDLTSIAKKAGVDRGLALTVIRCLIVKSEKETAVTTGLKSSEVKLPIVRCLRAMMDSINPALSVEGLAQSLSEIHECEKAVDWVCSLQDWFKNPYGKRIPEGKNVLSWPAACSIIPWISDFDEIIRHRVMIFAKEIGFKDDSSNMKFEFRTELDQSGKIILNIDFNPLNNQLPQSDGRNVSLMRLVIGYAKDAHSNNGIHNRSEVGVARPLLSRRQVFEKYSKKTGSAIPQRLNSVVLIAFLGGVHEVDAFEKPITLRVIRDCKQKDKPITTVFAQLIELRGAKRSMVVLPKELTWDRGARSARFHINSSAIRNFLKSGTFVGAKFNMTFFDESGALMGPAPGDVICTNWHNKDAPELRLSPAGVELAGVGQATLWNRWAEEWALGKCKVPPARPRHAEVKPRIACGMVQFRSSAIICAKELIGENILIVPTQSKKHGRLIMGIQKSGDLVFVLKGISSSSGKNLESLALAENSSEMRSLALEVASSYWNLFKLKASKS